MNKSLTPDLLESVYRHEAAPWSVLLLGHLQKSLAQPLNATQQQPFAAVNDALIYWWPEQRRFLRDIYGNELAKCWECYDRLSVERAELLHAAEGLLTCDYLQLQALQIFEQKTNPTRPHLPSDTKEYGFEEFSALINESFKDMPQLQQDRLVAWMEEVSVMPADRWSEAEASIIDITA